MTPKPASPISGTLHDDDAERQRQIDDHRHGRKQPDQLRTAIDAFDEEVPCGVAESRRENERKTENGHA